MYRNKAEKNKELLWTPNSRIDIYAKTDSKNELNETDYNYSKINTIWAQVIPQTGKLQTQAAETVLSSVTHKVKCRYEAGKDITEEMYMICNVERFDIKFILDPYYTHEFLEIFVEQVNY